VVASRIPVTSLTTSFSAASDVAVSKSPQCVATLPASVQGDGQRGEGSPMRGELDSAGLLNTIQLSKSHTAMAAI
jgi:hypothetical protein